MRFEELNDEVRKMLENYNDLDNNSKKNLVTFACVGILDFHKKQEELTKNG